MDCWTLRGIRRAEGAVCAICGRELEEGERGYALPDGLLICGEEDCLRDWAEAYRRWTERGAEG